MKKLLPFLKQNVHWLTLACFFVLQAIIFHTVPAFGDDYYYGTFVSSGFDYFVSENVFHYLHTNGRALVHLVTELVLADHSMIAFHIIGSLLSTGCALLLAMLSAETWKDGFYTKRFRLSLVLSCALLSLLSIEITRQSVYWATGNLNYFLPIPLLLLSVYLWRRGEKQGKITPFLLLLVFFTAWSTEQCGAATVACMALPVLLRFRERKKVAPVLYTLFGVAVLGFLLLLLAPGNRERMTYYPDFYEQSLWQRIIGNIPLVANGLTAPAYMGGAVALLLGADLGLCAFRYKKERRKSLLLFVCVDFVSLLPTFTVAQDDRFDILRASFLIVGMGVFAVRRFIRFWKQEETADVPFFFLLSVALQLCMLFSPEYGGRTVLLSVILTHLSTLFFVFSPEKGESGEENTDLLAYDRLFAMLFPMALSLAFTASFGFATLAAVLVLGAGFGLCFFLGRKKEALCFLLLLFLLFGFDNLLTARRGYAQNSTVHRANEAQITAWTLAGDEDAPLLLYYLKNGDCKHTMPYEDTYHLYWFKRYRGLPEQTEIVFDYYPY